MTDPIVGSELDGTRDIVGVATAIPAFIAPVSWGDTDPRLVRSFAEFSGLWKPSADVLPTHLPEAVRGFFENGGGTCYIVPTAGGGTDLAAYEAGLSMLESVPEVKAVIAPDLWRSEDDAPAIANAIAHHCATLGTRMAILHTRPGLDPTAAEKEPALVGLDEREARFATLYYPWLGVTGEDGVPRVVPAGGHVAGIWARVDARRGVHKAPANEAVIGVHELERVLTDDEQGPLNQAGVNCLRMFPGSGIRVWGARTLSDESDWRYLSVRRLINFLQESIRTGTTFAAFEPNDDALWSSLRRTIAAFLAGEWRYGALMGQTADEAFYVICDESNNPPDSIAAGQVVIDVGVAPVRPAEFVTFRIQQPSGCAPN